MIKRAGLDFKNCNPRAHTCRERDIYVSSAAGRADMKTKPSSEYALLGALMPGEKHGYEILKFLEESLSDFWSISSSQLYLLLKKLETRDLVVSAVLAQESRPSKRMFSLTDAGRQEFLDWVQRPVKHVRDLRIEFLAKLFFYEYLALPGGSALLRTQRETLTRVRESLAMEQIREPGRFQQTVLDFKLHTLEAWIGWLDGPAVSFIKEIS